MLPYKPHLTLSELCINLSRFRWHPRRLPCRAEDQLQQPWQRLPAAQQDAKRRDEGHRTGDPSDEGEGGPGPGGLSWGHGFV